MKRLKSFLILLALLVGLNGLTQNEVLKNTHKGNIFYQNNEFKDAVYYYEKALENAPFNFKASFNLANAFFKLKEYDKSIEELESIVDHAKTNEEKAMVYHNIGNAHLMNKQLDKGIEAYKEALRLNPKSEDTRYNLAYALLKNQEQEKKDQQKNQDQEKNQDQKKEEQEKGQDQKDKGEEEKNDQGNQEQQDNKDDKGNEDQKDGDKEDNKPQQNEGNKPQKLSKEQAKRLLEAAAKKEKDIQEKKDEKLKISSGKPKQKKDW